jgi:hypothetical protein
MITTAGKTILKKSDFFGFRCVADLSERKPSVIMSIY